MVYRNCLESSFLGKKINPSIDLDTVDDLYWRGERSGEEDGENECPVSGEGTLEVDSYDYTYESDDPGINDEEWTIHTRLYFEVENGEISSISIDCSVSCFGDSGLGECDPEEFWRSEDYDIAEKFFRSIILPEKE